MAKRFTFADAKEKIKQLEQEVDDLRGVLKDEFESATLDDSDNVYTTQEKKYIQFYKFYTWITLGIGALLLIVSIGTSKKDVAMDMDTPMDMPMDMPMEMPEVDHSSSLEDPMMDMPMKKDSMG